MLELRRKSANAITIMATSVAMIVSIKNCHQRATAEIQIIPAIDATFSNPPKTDNNSQHFYFGKQKPISSKMAYALLQALKKANPQDKAVVLEKFHVSETQLVQQLTPIALEKRGKIVVAKNFPVTTFNPNELDSQTWVNQLYLKPWKLKYIERYRKRLGGFYSLSQLREIPQLDSHWMATTWEFIEQENLKNRSFPVEKFNKNSTWKQWYQHPYAGAQIAKILQPFYAARTCVSLKELQAIKEISATQLAMILPYLSIDCKD